MLEKCTRVGVMMHWNREDWEICSYVALDEENRTTRLKWSYFGQKNRVESSVVPASALFFSCRNGPKESLLCHERVMKIYAWWPFPLPLPPPNLMYSSKCSLAHLPSDVPLPIWSETVSLKCVGGIQQTINYEAAESEVVSRFSITTPGTSLALTTSSTTSIPG